MTARCVQVGSHGQCAAWPHDAWEICARTRAVDCSASFARVLLECTVPCVAHSGLSGTCLVCVVEGREAAGVWTSPMAFVTTTLALIVHSPICMRAW